MLEKFEIHTDAGKKGILDRAAVGRHSPTSGKRINLLTWPATAINPFLVLLVLCADPPKVDVRLQTR